jgi:hypothetical protein
MDQTVTFGQRPAPSWPAVRALLAGRGYPVQMRMIDGGLAFPDEEPPEAWRELRVAAPEGMVTLRRTDGGVTLVTWGNADAGLRQAWNALAWAFAEAGGGTVHTERGSLDAAAFVRTAELPAALQSKSGGPPNP